MSDAFTDMEPRTRRDKRIIDDFNGDNRALKRSIKALIELDDDNALVPHGIGGHARGLLAACYRRLSVRKK